MGNQDRAEVVPLFGESEEVQPDVIVSWARSEVPDPGGYKRLLELLFLSRDSAQQGDAA